MTQVLALSGSLRARSFNTAALHAAQELAPEGMTITLYEGMSDLPPYNRDVEQAGYPPPVADLHAQIRAADALLIATPEYNYSIPGVLKNAIDWATRPPGDAPVTGMPAAILGVTTGMWGTVRAQLHLREILHHNALRVVAKPEVYINQARDKFTDNQLTDEATRDFIRQLLENLHTLAN